MEHHQITVGLLPFGLSHPQAEKIAAALAAQGFAVLRTPADCTQKTPAEIVRRLVADGSDCIVAQSSAELETAEVPVITANPSSVNSTVDFVRAVAAARALPGMRVASIGGSFDGMGDFLISVEEIKREFEVEVIYANSDELRACREAITDKAVTDEIALDLAAGKPMAEFSRAAHERSTRDCLVLRRWLAQTGIGAFTVNFRKIGKHCGLDTMPFMEACKAMARGVGYAGEGDVLTAAFCGALRQGFTQTTFIEIFCPDWAGNRLMLSHMGEMNYGCVDDALTLAEMDFVYGDAENPIVGFGCYCAGEAVFVNVYCDGNGYHLLLSPVSMEKVACDDRFANKVRGWMRPKMPLERFLEGLSIAGATHHSILVYDTSIEALRLFGRLCNLDVQVLA